MVSCELVRRWLASVGTLTPLILRDADEQTVVVVNKSDARTFDVLGLWRMSGRVGGLKMEVCHSVTRAGEGCVKGDTCAEQRRLRKTRGARLPSKKAYLDHSVCEGRAGLGHQLQHAAGHAVGG